jgi:pimeloyl-ACP methyl ester carboxylesterase
MMAAIDLKPLDAPGIGGLTAGRSDSPETLLFLHGWGGSKELWWNTLLRLGDRCRCIALDLPGAGETPLLGSMRTMADFAEWLESVCGQLRLPKATVVGHSLGGNLAAQFALDHPERAASLVLVDAALEPAHFPARARWPLSPRYGRAALRLARWSAWPLACLGRTVPNNHPGGHWLPYARRNYLYLARNTDAAMRVQLRALLDNPHEASRLAALQIPLLIVHGGRDSIVPAARSIALAEAVPQARLVVFANAHHCPMDSDPAAFAQTLRDFLTSTKTTIPT